MNRVRQLSAAGLLGIVMIFELAAFALLSLRDESFDYKALIFAGGLIVVLLLQYIIILWKIRRQVHTRHSQSSCGHRHDSSVQAFIRGGL